MKKLRLLVTKECYRNCDGCCNKNFELDTLPVVPNDLSGYDEILITGGEPLLFPEFLKKLVSELRAKFGGKIYLYTAIGDVNNYMDELNLFDGINITIHDDGTEGDILSLTLFEGRVNATPNYNKSNRLHIFKKVRHWVPIIPAVWKSVIFTDWIENCPIPKEEEFMKLETLWTK